MVDRLEIDYLKSFLYVEQFVTSSPGKEFFLESYEEALRLHYITGNKFFSEKGVVDNPPIKQIQGYKIRHPLEVKTKKVLLLDRTTEPLRSVGWHIHEGLKDLAENLDYKAYNEEIDYKDYDIIISVDAWDRPKDFNGIYVLYDTEALHRQTKKLIAAVQKFDYAFLSTLQDVEILNYLGYSHVFWEPPAANPQLHKPVETPPKFTMHAAFIATNVEDLKRNGMNRYDFVSQTASDIGILFGAAGVGKKYVEELWKAPIALDRTNGYNIGTRPFETLASGRFSITNILQEKNKRTGLNLLLTPNIHYGLYEDNPKSCNEEIKFWINRSDRDELAREASNFVHKYHTWKLRLASILRKVLNF